MESNNQIDGKDGQTAPGDLPRSESRRKLIRGALAGAPILLALKSTPVLACNCKLPSGFSTSGNLSRNGGATCTQPANGPSWWPSRTERIQGKLYFRGTGVKTETAFNSIFLRNNDTRTFMAALTGGLPFQQLVVSAYLNIKAGAYVVGVSITDIKNMWNLSYTPPGGGAAWSAKECENYLRYTMGQPLLS